MIPAERHYFPNRVYISNRNASSSRISLIQLASKINLAIRNLMAYDIFLLIDLYSLNRNGDLHNKMKVVKCERKGLS